MAMAQPGPSGNHSPLVKSLDKVSGVSEPAHYVSNRQPLHPSALIKLPIGQIKPRGWLRTMLELEAEGMTGKLREISPWLNFEKSAWTDPQGRGSSGWEEMPYWLKGFGDLGYVLGNEAIIQEARRWIEAVLATQREDGWFGPRELLTSLKGQPDLWPHMVMLNVLQSFHEATGDGRIPPFMTRYFRWQDKLPPAAFGAGYWPKIRAGDNIESIYWLYNRTGEDWLLGLARKIHDNMAPWASGVIDWHNVNIAQGFREPAVFFLQAKEPRFLQQAMLNYQTVMGLYGQFPGGGFAGDENCRPGFVDPRQGFETCGIVEFMHSFEMLSRISGDPVWADLCEEIAFNSFPASMTPDQKALHYLTGANMIQLDRHNKSPGLQNGGTMLSYSPFQVYRCCQHNVSHGWPYYAEELWLATTDKGLCASLYAPSEVTAKVGEGTQVRITETTDYPFEDTIRLKVQTDQPVRFPLYLRIPKWSGQPRLTINGQGLKSETRPPSFLVVDRAWSDGDTLTLQLPMSVQVRTWKKNKDSVSVDYGPLTYSLRIGERWERYGGTNQWGEFEVFPATPWNYGLVLDRENPAASFKVVRKPGRLADQPFTPENAPIRLEAKARRIPAWRQDRLGLVGLLQPSPVKSEEPVETITLIPMGAARLRITSFPVIGDGPDAHEWVAPPQPKPQPYKASASHVHGSDTVEALGDAEIPSSSHDQSISRFTWWDHKGTTEWVQYDLKGQRRVQEAEVYWFDDTGHGGNCRVPASWRLLYREGEEWKPVRAASAYETRKDQFNKVTFEPVETTALRLEVQLAPGLSGGILEWRVK